ncbi:MFS transporter [Nocardia miyunensis]|uniref:MFS transporter n=1 Tax=Nocardia miyunensis TaxID=282684 RepID=UPI000837570F|nr:MFS transporter [Nocardia miyunensis]
MTNSVPATAMVPPTPEAGWRSYLVDLWQAPPRAKAALAGCLLLMVVSPSGLSAMTTFIVPAYARATRVSVSDGLLVFVTLPLLVGPVVLPFAGRWVDRLGARRVAIPSAVLYVGVTALVPVCGSSVPMLAVVLILAAVCGFMTTLAVVFKVVSTWLPQHKGIGFALIGAVSSLASAVLSPLFQWLINGDVAVPEPAAGGSAPGAGGAAALAPAPSVGANVFTGLGWGGTYLLVAVAIAVIAIPTAIFLISEPKIPHSTNDEQAPRRPGPPDIPAGLPGIPLRKALPTRAWIFIAIFLAFASTGPMAVRQNAVGFFGERGFSAATVSVSLSALFIASIVGLLLGGVILDRTDRPLVVAPILAAVPAGLVIALTNHGSTPLLFLSMIFLGFATGAESALGPYLIARYFGLVSFAQLQGLTLAISTLSLGLAPFLVSAVQAATGSYAGPVLTITALTAIAVVLAALLPKFPPQWKTFSDN